MPIGCTKRNAVEAWGALVAPGRHVGRRVILCSAGSEWASDAKDFPRIELSNDTALDELQHHPLSISIQSHQETTSPRRHPNTLEGARNVSSIDRLPKELIGEIIFYATDAVDLDFSHGIWAYSQVSRAWRSEALSRASNWANIYADLFADTKCKLRFPEDLSELALLRSNDHDLTITLRLPAKSHASVVMLEACMKHCTRWKTVHLDLPEDLIGRLQKVYSRLPRLENLRLRSGVINPYHRSIPEKDHDIGPSFSDAPSLQRVWLNIPWPVESVELPWTQISLFKDDSYTVSNTGIQLINQMPRLLSYHATTVHWGAGDEVQLISHNRIRSLSIRSLPPANIMRKMRLPSLSEIHIWSQSDLPALQDLFEQSGCTITTVVFHESPCGLNFRPIKEFVSFGETLSFIKVLEFRYGPDFSIMPLLYTNQTMFPRVQTLKLAHEWLQHFGSGISDIVTSRVASGSLKELRFIGKWESLPEQTRDIYGRFQALESTGLLVGFEADTTAWTASANEMFPSI